jgi:ribosomal protein S18 acetylase RimI-like enzyme
LGLSATGSPRTAGYFWRFTSRRTPGGRRLFLHGAEALFLDGARYLYVCPDPVTGEPFWSAMGFRNSGIVDPDDRLPIFIRRRDREEIVCRAMRPEDLHPRMMDEYEQYREIRRVWRKLPLLRRWHAVNLHRAKIVEPMPAFGRTKYIQNTFIGCTYRHEYYPDQPPVFAAFAGNQLLGFAVWEHFKDRAVLFRLFVSFDCRRMGLGRELFRLCAEDAKAAGETALYISTDRAAPAQAFYEAMGCTLAKKRIFGPKEDVPREYDLTK